MVGVDLYQQLLSLPQLQAEGDASHCPVPARSQARWAAQLAEGTRENTAVQLFSHVLPPVVTTVEKTSCRAAVAKNAQQTESLHRLLKLSCLAFFPWSRADAGRGPNYGQMSVQVGSQQSHCQSLKQLQHTHTHSFDACSVAALYKRSLITELAELSGLQAA